MNSRYIIAVLAVLASTAGCQHARTAGDSRPTLGEQGPRSLTRHGRPPVTKTKEVYTDDEQNQVHLKIEEGKPIVEVVDKNNKPLQVKQLQLENRASVCFDAAKTNCQVLKFVSDGSFMKVGTASCTCVWCYGVPYCYGDSCP